jgi:1-acyl-sn-glycerol-3-phosphate acyltransferase
LPIPKAIRFLHAIDRLYSRGFHQVEVRGEQKIPRVGAGVIVANHISSLDPVLIQSAIARPVVWMMASEYVDVPGLRQLFNILEVIPVARNGKDSAALRAALRVLKQGKLLGIFPEGRISTTRSLGAFETGAAMIAIRAGATVYPVQIDGTPRRQGMTRVFAFPQCAKIYFAPPLVLPADRTPAGLESATDIIRRAIDFSESD